MTLAALAVVSVLLVFSIKRDMSRIETNNICHYYNRH